MDEQEYRERLLAFKNSCRVYKSEKQMLKNSASGGDPKLVQYLREDVESVDRIFSLVKELCGTSAVLMLVMLYVEEKTQADVAYQLGITRRQLQYSVSKYLHMVFEEEKNRAG